MIGACCRNESDIIYPESQIAYEYFYFDAGSWWEFEQADGSRMRLEASPISRTLFDVYEERVYEERGRGPFRCSSPGKYTYQTYLYANAVLPDTFRFALKGESYAYPGMSASFNDGWNYGSTFFGFARRSTDTTIAASLIDSNLVVSLNGRNVDSVRRYQFHFHWGRTFRGPNLFAPEANIGPVLIGLSDGNEWKLTEYHIVKPPLN